MKETWEEGKINTGIRRSTAIHIQQVKDAAYVIRQTRVGQNEDISKVSSLTWWGERSELDASLFGLDRSTATKQNRFKFRSFIATYEKKGGEENLRS
jgi:stress response protein SCP2